MFGLIFISAKYLNGKLPNIRRNQIEQLQYEVR